MTKWNDHDLTMEIRQKGELSPEEELALSEALKKEHEKLDKFDPPEPDDKEFAERTKRLIQEATIEAKAVYLMSILEGGR